MTPDPHPSNSLSAVLRPENLPRYDRSGGATTTPLVTPSVGATGFINVITELVPHAAISFHSHNCEESVMILEGEAIFEIENGESYHLKPLDTTWIAPRVSHRFRNASDTQNMKLLGIYASVNATRTASATGETRAISDEHVRSLRK